MRWLTSWEPDPAVRDFLVAMEIRLRHAIAATGSGEPVEIDLVHVSQVARVVHLQLRVRYSGGPAQARLQALIRSHEAPSRTADGLALDVQWTLVRRLDQVDAAYVVLHHGDLLPDPSLPRTTRLERNERLLRSIELDRNLDPQGWQAAHTLAQLAPPARLGSNVLVSLAQFYARTGGAQVLQMISTDPAA